MRFYFKVTKTVRELPQAESSLGSLQAATCCHHPERLRGRSRFKAVKGSCAPSLLLLCSCVLVLTAVHCFWPAQNGVCSVEHLHQSMVIPTRRPGPSTPPEEEREVQARADGADSRAAAQQAAVRAGSSGDKG